MNMIIQIVKYMKFIKTCQRTFINKQSYCDMQMKSLQQSLNKWWEHCKVWWPLEYSVRHLAERKVHCISSHMGGRCCFRWNSIWSSSSLCLCLQAVHVEPLNRGCLFHQYVNPACIPRYCAGSQHTTIEKRVSPHSLIEHVEFHVALSEK